MKVIYDKSFYLYFLLSMYNLPGHYHRQKHAMKEFQNHMTAN